MLILHSLSHSWFNAPKKARLHIYITVLVKMKFDVDDPFAVR